MLFQTGCAQSDVSFRFTVFPCKHGGDHREFTLPSASNLVPQPKRAGSGALSIVWPLTWTTVRQEKIHLPLMRIRSTLNATFCRTGAPDLNQRTRSSLVTPAGILNLSGIRMKELKHCVLDCVTLEQRLFRQRTKVLNVNMCAETGYHLFRRHRGSIPDFAVFICLQTNWPFSYTNIL